MRRLLLETFAALAGGYLAVVGGLAVVQRDMIYHPGSNAGDPADAGLPEMVPVPIRTDDGWVVTGWYAPPPVAGKPTVLFLHGNGGTIANRAHKARGFLNAGMGVYLAGYRGYGGNPGRPSEQGLYHDGRAALAWLTQRGVPENRIAVYGESLGTGVAVQVVSERAVAALVLEAPFTRLPELAPPVVVPAMADMLVVDRYDNLAKIGEVTVPTLILHGEQDGTVPVAMGRRLLDASGAAEKRGLFLPKAGHNDLWDYGAGDVAAEFIEDVME